MSPPAKPLVYVILGAAGSGRRGVLADLIEDGLAPGARPVVLLASTEAPAEADARLGRVVRWTWAGDGRIEAEPPADADPIFFVTDGRASPVDQMEALKPWIAAAGAELGRVFCVVHCRLAEQHDELLAWYDACIHFSDVVLLNRREGVANKWLSDFRRRYEDRFFPCLFEFVKDGRIRNPALLLEPQARRMSLYFDEGDSTAAAPGSEGDYEFVDEVGDEADDKAEDDESVEVDPYFALDAAGRRAKRIPEVAKFLG